MASSSPSVDQTEPWGILKDQVLVQCEKILVEHPENRACKYTIEYLKSEEGKNLSEEGTLCQMVVFSR
jgi:5-methylcytosine-specific restriction endonuclease McrBC regulatory subunit McrC